MNWEILEGFATDDISICLPHSDKKLQNFMQSEMRFSLHNCFGTAGIGASADRKSVV